MKKYNGTLLLQYDPIHYTWIVFSLTDSKVELDEYFKDALDFIISRKVLNKLEGRFEDSIKPNLEELLALIDKTYGFNNFNESKKVIRRLLKRF